MMQPAQSILRKNPPGRGGANSVVRGSLPQPKMRAVLVVVADVFRKQTFQMAFIHGNDVIQQISSAAFNPTLRYTILPRAFEGRSYRAHLQGSNGDWNLQPVLSVAVENKKPRSQLKRKRFSQLLHDPQASRMLGDVEVQDASTAVADDEEAIEHAKVDRWHGEEVHGRNRFPVVSKEGEPAFSWLGISRRPFHPTRNGSLTEIKTEHKKLAVNARRSPGWILNNHPEDQLSNFLRRRLPPHPCPDSRDQFPVQAKTSSVPANYGFRRDDEKSLFPAWPEATDGDPEQFVEWAQARASPSPLQHGKLLA